MGARATIAAAVALLLPAAAALGQGPETATDKLRRAADPTVDAVVDALRADPEAPVFTDAVLLALYRYARTGDPDDLVLAESLARRASGAAQGVASPGALYYVADAGGGTAAEAEAAIGAARDLLTVSSRRATTDSFARLVLDFFARAGYLGTEEAYLEAIAGAGALFATRIVHADRMVDVVPGGGEAPRAGLSDRTECLNVAVLNTAATGAPVSMALARDLGHALLRSHWDDAASRLKTESWETVGMPAAVDAVLNARAALALWRAGQLTGEPLFSGRAQRVIAAVREKGLADPVSAPAVALADAVIGEGPLLVLVVGDPVLTEMIWLRRDAVGVFYPGKVVIPLDPATDMQRIRDLGCPGNADRAAYIVRDGDCGNAVLSGASLAEAIGSPEGALRVRSRGPR